MATGYDWIFWTVGGSFAALALWMLYVALLKDWVRHRSTRRCPKCWYDMSGTRGTLTCSECGHAAKRERKLYNTRRRWRLVPLCSLCALASIAAIKAPAVRRDGILKHTPTTALLILLPYIDDANSVGWHREAFDEVMERATLSTRRGVDAKILSGWQWRILLRRAISSVQVQVPGDPMRPFTNAFPQGSYIDLLGNALRSGKVHRAGLVNELNTRFPVRALIQMPPRWIRDAEIPFHFECESSFSFLQCHIDVLTKQGESLYWRKIHPPDGMRRINLTWKTNAMIAHSFRDGEAPLQFRMSLVVPPLQQGDPELVYWTTDFFHNVLIDGLLKEQMTLLNSAEMDNRVCKRLRLEFERDKQHFPILRASLSGSSFEDLDPLGRIGRLKLVCGGLIAYDESAAWNFVDSRLVADFNLTKLIGFHFAKPRIDGAWSLKFSMDPVAMLLWTPESTSVWDGAIDESFDWDRLFAGEPIVCRRVHRPSPN